MKELSNKDRPKKLEDIFREGMEEAEIAPSDLLWSRIERNLNHQETNFYKQRMVWYQRLAAACIVLVLFAGAYLYLDARRPVVPVATVQEILPSPATRQSALRAANPQVAATTTHAPAGPGPANQKALLPAREPAARAGARAAAQQPAFRNSTTTGRQPYSGTYARVHPADGQSNIHAPQAAAGATMPAPDPADEKLLAGTPAAGEKPAQAGTSPDRLTPLLAWPGMSRLAALEDTIAGRLLTLAAAPAIVEQPSTAAPKQGSRWRFGGKYASQFFDQNIALANNQPMMAPNMMVPQSMALFSTAGSATYADALQEFDRETGSGFSFNTGISAAYQLTEHLDLETGLGYTQNVATSNSSYIFNNTRISSRYAAGSSADWGANASKNAVVVSGIPATAFLASLAGGVPFNQTAVTKTQSFDTQYRYRMLGIPVKVSYQTSRGKSFYFASMGMLTNLLVQAHVLSDSEQVPDLTYTSQTGDSPFRNWQFAAVASAGKGFEIAPGLQLKAGLEATQYLTHLAQHPDNLKEKQHKPYTIGLALSSSYTFGK